MKNGILNFLERKQSKSPASNSRFSIVFCIFFFIYLCVYIWTNILLLLLSVFSGLYNGDAEVSLLSVAFLLCLSLIFPFHLFFPFTHLLFCLHRHCNAAPHSIAFDFKRILKNDDEKRFSLLMVYFLVRKFFPQRKNRSSRERKRWKKEEKKKAEIELVILRNSYNSFGLSMKSYDLLDNSRSARNFSSDILLGNDLIFLNSRLDI